MYLAEKKGKTEKGNYYCILQDTRTSFQISVTVGRITQHETVNNPSSLEELDEMVIALENDLIEATQINDFTSAELDTCAYSSLPAVHLYDTASSD